MATRQNKINTVEVETRKCQYCGNLFVPYNSRHKTCDNSECKIKQMEENKYRRKRYRLRSRKIDELAGNLYTALSTLDPIGSKSVFMNVVKKAINELEVKRSDLVKVEE